MPKAVKEALKQFATEARLKELEDIIETTLRPLLRPEDVPEPQGDEPGPTGDDDTDALLQEQLQAWEEGTEEYATWSREKLMEMLGLTGLQTDTFPYFNRTCDRTSAKRSAWDSEQWKQVLADAAEVALVPHWHQLVGVLKILVTHGTVNAMMVMDQVGIGKTMQAIGVLAMRWVLIKAQKEKAKLPGELST